MIDTIVQAEIENLAPMPASIARLASVVGDANASAQDIAQVIELDQALTANVLRLANSAWSAAAKAISSVREAVLRLGGARILELAVGHRLVRSMSGRCDGYGLGEYELWRQSVAAALAAERLDRFVMKPVPGVAFTAALVHDIGKLLLNRHLDRDVVAQIQTVAESEHLVQVETERRVLGTDHAEVGGVIASHWKFPAPLVQAIKSHHDPDVQPNALLDAVHIANAVAKLVGMGLGSEGMNMRASPESGSRLGLTATGLESLCAVVVTDLAKTEELWGCKRHGA